MNREDHLKVDKVLYNKTFNKVHAWLDSTWPEYADHPIPFLHWLKYHHIEAIREKYGDFTPEFNAAYTHILCDFVSHFNMAYVPRNMIELIDTFTALKVIEKDR